MASTFSKRPEPLESHHNNFHRAGCIHHQMEATIDYLCSDDAVKHLQPRTKRLKKLEAIESEKKLLRSIHEILSSMGMDNYDPLVLRQLSSFVHNHIRSIMLRAKRLHQHRLQSLPSTSAASSSSSSSSTTTDTTTASSSDPSSFIQLSLTDIQAAVRSWGQNRAHMQEDSSIAHRQAQQLNRKQLPKIKAVFGMQVPTSSMCFLNEEYTVTVVEEADSDAIEISSSSSSGNGNGNGNRNSHQHRRKGRKRERNRNESDSNQQGSNNNDDIDFNQIQPSTKRSRTQASSDTINIQLN